jgi:phosphoglucosamine mutase
VADAVAAVEAALGERGRVLVRYSGTQPLCRVMVEGPTREVVERSCRSIVDVVQEALGIRHPADA